MKVNKRNSKIQCQYKNLNFLLIREVYGMEGVRSSVQNPKTGCAKYCFVPQRYLTALMGALGVMCALLMRNTLDIIINNIIKLKDRKEVEISPLCSNNLTFGYDAKIEFEDQYYWATHDTAQLEDIFYYGYFLGHLPGGYLGDMYGGKHVFGGTIILSALITAITPLAMKQTRSATSLVYLRFVLGSIQGALYPSLNSIISCWTPTRDRGRITGIIFSADLFGTVLSNMLISTKLKDMADWSYFFYWYSGASVLWYILWNLICYSYPSRCPFLGEKEKAYLENELEGHVIYGKKKVPFLRILASTPLWMVVFIEIASDWVYFSMITDLPQYLEYILGYKFNKHRLLATVPNSICGLACIVNGFIADYFLNKHWLNVTTLRQIFVTMRVMGPPIFIVAATFGNCNANLTMLLFTIGFTLMASFYTGGRIVTLDLAPNFSGIVMAVVNGIGTLSGSIPQHIENLLITSVTNIGDWRNIFLVSLGISAITNLLFSIWGSGKEQAWNNANENEREEEDDRKEGEEEEKEEEKEEEIANTYTQILK